MIPEAIFIILVFVAVILMITFDMTDHTIAALIGAAVAIIFLAQIWPTWRAGQIEYYTNIHPDPERVLIYQNLNPIFTTEVFAYFFTIWIDLPTIIIILSLMVITEISKDSGLFQFIAVKALSFSKGSPRRLLLIFCGITFLMSTVLATTVLIIGPLTILACDALEQNPAPYLIAGAMCGNVGGITTMIASVPTMLIAGPAGVDFAWFVINLMPLGLMLLGLTIFISLRYFRKEFITPRPERIRDLMALDAWTMVEDRGVFYRTAFLFVAIIAGFVILGPIGLTWVVALVGALFFILFSGIPPNRIFREVEWNTLFFFIGLFIVVGCLEEFGILEFIGTSVANLTGGIPWLATVSVLWITGFTSGMIDNIPVTATLIPVVPRVAQTVPIATGTLWASLAVGAVLGGALTPIASAANVLTMTVAQKEKRPISYQQFLKVGAIMFGTYLIFGTLYLLLRLWIFPILPLA